ncbi:MAG: ATP-binding cassette domain-containing protein [Thermoleophilia bacterium]
MSDDLMIEAVALSKRYGETQALDKVNLAVTTGSIVGVLGPNGAGKTTGLRILTTLSTPDSGRARVAGHDVVSEAAAVRRKIGVTGQDATLDDALTGRQNLVLIGELSRLRRQEARRRAVELLELFELADAADRVVKGYSGGMRRRLDLAASLVMRPPLLFLDEPTTGLDPTSRQRMWGLIRGLVADGATVLLTTQYLDEADSLADRIAVMNEGRVIAEGTPSELKATTGSQFLEVTLSAPHEGAAAALAALSIDSVRTSADGLRLWTSARNEPGLAVAALRALDRAGAVVDDIAVHRPSLDDVFAVLTEASTAPADEAVPA